MRRAAIAVTAVLLTGALALGGAYLLDRQKAPSFDRVSFAGGDREKRELVGRFILAVRDRDTAAILRLDRGAEFYADPNIVAPGARWLVDNYAHVFDAPLRVAYQEGENSVLDFLACISHKPGDGLLVSAGRRSESSPYRITVGDYGSPLVDGRPGGESFSCGWA
ncbi:hypothetical protein [Thermomonospora cellulosilytica]|uniref:Uncharacterized protein n=1 Tax=Thermomonospora cellulosilytica TaxID=1411118 RepID=A0A7W3N5K1_9ACTN|nr:hypothetical protein [Thermomonospora cellulosilytica]MBA9007932.1 hypothetical protein [Thermomonospora cellulosilytica]